MYIETTRLSSWASAHLLCCVDNHLVSVTNEFLCMAWSNITLRTWTNAGKEVFLYFLFNSFPAQWLERHVPPITLKCNINHQPIQKYGEARSIHMFLKEIYAICWKCV